MLIEHRGEVEYDFRNLLHTGYKCAVESDIDEVFRLTRQLLRNTGSRLFAAVAKWEQPLSTEAFIAASLYSAWAGERHPLLPDVSDNPLSDVDVRLADMALERMNRR